MNTQKAQLQNRNKSHMKIQPRGQLQQQRGLIQPDD